MENNKPIKIKGCLKPLLENLNSESNVKDSIIFGGSSNRNLIPVAKICNNTRDSEHYGTFILLKINEKTEQGGKVEIPIEPLGKQVEFVNLLIQHSFFKRTNKDNYYSTMFFPQLKQDIKFYNNGKVIKVCKTYEEAKAYASEHQYKTKCHLYSLIDGLIVSYTIKGVSLSSYIEFSKANGIQNDKFGHTIITEVGQEQDNYFLTDFRLGRAISSDEQHVLKVTAETLYYYLIGDYNTLKLFVADVTEQSKAKISEDKSSTVNTSLTEGEDVRSKSNANAKSESKNDIIDDLYSLKPFQIKNKIKNLMNFEDIKNLYGIDVQKIFSTEKLIEVYHTILSEREVA